MLLPGQNPYIWVVNLSIVQKLLDKTSQMLLRKDKPQDHMATLVLIELSSKLSSMKQSLFNAHHLASHVKT